jgi:hypothetical protein
VIVDGRPEPRSFNGGMRDFSVETLTTADQPAVAIDLHAMRFELAVNNFAQSFGDLVQELK